MELRVVTYSSVLFNTRGVLLLNNSMKYRSKFDIITRLYYCIMNTYSAMEIKILLLIILYLELIPP